MKDEKKMVKEFLNIYRNTLGIAMENLQLKVQAQDSTGYTYATDDVEEFILYWSTFLSMMNGFLYYFIYHTNIAYKDDIEEIYNNSVGGLVSNPLFESNIRIFEHMFDEYANTIDDTIVITMLDESVIIKNINDSDVDTTRFIYKFEYNNYKKYIAYSVEVYMDHGEYTKKPITINIGKIDLKAYSKNELASILRSCYTATDFFTLAIVNMVKCMDFQDIDISTLTSASDINTYYNDMMHCIDIIINTSDSLSMDDCEKAYDNGIANDILEKYFVDYASVPIAKLFSKYKSALSLISVLTKNDNEDSNNADSSTLSIEYNKDPIPGSKDGYNPDSPVSTIENSDKTYIPPTSSLSSVSDEVRDGMLNFIKKVHEVASDSKDDQSIDTDKLTDTIKDILFGNIKNSSSISVSSDDVVKIDKSNNPVEQLDVLSQNMCDEFFLGTSKNWFSIKRALEFPLVDGALGQLEKTANGSFPTYKIPIVLTENLIKKLDEETEKTDAIGDNRVGRFYLNGDSLCIILFNKNKAKAIVGLCPNKDAIWKKYYPKAVSEEIMSLINKVKAQDPNTYDDYWFIAMTIYGYYACSLSHIKLNTNIPIIIYPRLMKYIYRITSLALKKKIMYSYKDHNKKKKVKKAKENANMIRINYLHKEEPIDDLSKAFSKEYDNNSIKKKSAVLLKNMYKYYSDMQTRIESGEPLPKNRGRIEYYVRLTGEDKKYNTKYRDLVVTNKGYMYPSKTTNALSEYRDAALEVYDKNHVYLYIQDTDIEDDNYLLKAISNTLKYVEYTKENEEEEFNIFGEE